MRTSFDVMDIEFQRGIRFEKEIAVFDDDGQYVPLSEMVSVTAVLKSTDNINGDTLLSFQVDVIDDEKTTLKVWAAAPATASFQPKTIAGYFFLYYTDVTGELVPLKRGKLNVR